MHRQHVVLDTNVIISAILFGGKPRKIMELIVSGTIDCSLSVPILDELTNVLQRPKFNFSSSACFQIAQHLYEICNIVSPSIRIDAVQNDQDDNRILECATEAKAEFIITGDPHLLSMKRFEQICILSPADYLRLKDQ